MQLKTINKKILREILESRFSNDNIKRIKELPPPSSLKDIDIASKRVKDSIARGEKIVIVGDYDADGVVASAIISTFFEDIGVTTSLVLPNRFRDGYGLSEEIARTIDANLVITVDNGITSFDAAKILKKREINLIITDHHTPKENLPEAFAIINPKRDDCTFPNSDICGAQVAWYFCAAIKNELKIDLDMSKYFDLLGLAIIGDVMPLLDINRVMLKKALKALNSSNRAPFLVLKNRLNIESFDAQDVAFKIVPRINSAGRMSEAKVAFKFLTSTNIENATNLYLELENLNNSRKEIEREITNEAISKANSSSQIIVVDGEGWHEGVIGIVASRLVDRYKKPAIVFSVDRDEAKGSARSFGDLDIFEILKESSILFKKFGGHKGAAGILMDASNIEELKSQLFNKKIEISFFDDSNLLGEIDFGYIDDKFMETILDFEPYGEGNEEPLFLTSNLVVGEVFYSKDNLHSFLKVYDKFKNRFFKAIGYGMKIEIEIGKDIELKYQLRYSYFRGKKDLNLIIKSYKII